MKSSEKPSTTKKATTKATTKKVAEPKTKETKTSTSTSKKTTKKVDDTEVKKTTKKEVVKEEKKTTTKKTAVKKETTKEPTKVAASKKTIAKKGTTKAKVEEQPITELPIMAEEVVTEEALKVPVPEHVTVSTDGNAVVVTAVTPEKTANDLSDALSHDAEKVDLALKDVANTSAIIYDGYNVSVNGKIMASFRKCIIHTDSRDFFNDITFALHNRFPSYNQELFNKVVDILDTSPSRFNVIIG